MLIPANPEFTLVFHLVTHPNTRPGGCTSRHAALSPCHGVTVLVARSTTSFVTTVTTFRRNILRQSTVMRGLHAPLLDIGLAVLFISMLGICIWDLAKARRRKPTNTFHKNDVDKAPAMLAGVLIMSLLSAVGANTLIREIRFHRDLLQLTPISVAQIEVGDQTVTDDRQIAAIVHALNISEWYNMRRSDAGADEVPFVIRLRTGGQRSYKVTQYRRGRGAIVISQSPSGFYNGQALCVGMPDLLAKAGITLPPCLTYGSGHPVRCPVE